MSPHRQVLSALRARTTAALAPVVAPVLAFTLALLTVSCTTDPTLRDAAGPEVGRVLVLSPPGRPVIQLVVDLLKAGPGIDPPLPRLTAEVVHVASVADVTAAVRKPQLPLSSYRAIFTNSITYARAAQLVAPEVPIVFEGVDDPVARCVVDSLQRPGRNATGFMHQLPGDDLKMLETLIDAYPALRTVTVLVSHFNIPPPDCDPNNPYWTQPPPTDCVAGERPLDAYLQRRLRAGEIADFVAARGLSTRFIVICKPEDFATLPADAERHPDSAWFVPWHGLFDRNRAALVAAVARSERPAIYPNHRYTQEGGLMSLAIVADDGPDRASVLALAQVLQGARPATLPVQTPRGFSLVINAQTAQRLPQRPSLLVLRRADTILR